MVKKGKKKEDSEDESNFEEEDSEDDKKSQKKPAAKKAKTVKKADKKKGKADKSKGQKKSKPAAKKGKSKAAQDDDDDDEIKEEDSYDITQDFLPGQKFATPDEDNGVRIFYETLNRQKPSSEMALKYCMENGLLKEADAKKAFAKFSKKKK